MKVLYFQVIDEWGRTREERDWRMREIGSTQYFSLDGSGLDDISHSKVPVLECCIIIIIAVNNNNVKLRARISSPLASWQATLNAT